MNNTSNKHTHLLLSLAYTPNEMLSKALIVSAKTSSVLPLKRHLERVALRCLKRWQHARTIKCEPQWRERERSTSIDSCDSMLVHVNVGELHAFKGVDCSGMSCPCGQHGHDGDVHGKWTFCYLSQPFSTWSLMHKSPTYPRDTLMSTVNLCRTRKTMQLSVYN